MGFEELMSKCDIPRLQISIKKAQAVLLSQLRHQMLLTSLLIADVMGLNAAVCDFAGIHPVRCSTRGKTSEKQRERERCVIILHYRQLFYFPQQQRKILCRNDSYQSKDGRSVSETWAEIHWSVAALCTFWHILQVCIWMFFQLLN